MVLALMALAVRLPAQVEGEEEAAVRKSIARVQARWAEAFRRQNGNLFYQVFIEDGAFMGASGRPVVGPEKISKVMASNMELIGPAEVRFATIQLFLLSGQAWETGRCAYLYGPRDKRQTTSGLYVAVWNRQPDGSWRLQRFVSLPET